VFVVDPSSLNPKFYLNQGLMIHNYYEKAKTITQTTSYKNTCFMPHRKYKAENNSHEERSAHNSKNDEK